MLLLLPEQRQRLRQIQPSHKEINVTKSEALQIVTQVIAQVKGFSIEDAKKVMMAMAILEQAIKEEAQDVKGESGPIQS